MYGHVDLTRATDPMLVMDSLDGSVAATAKLAQFTKIAPKYIGSFPSHGDAADELGARHHWAE